MSHPEPRPRTPGTPRSGMPRAPAPEDSAGGRADEPLDPLRPVLRMTLSQAVAAFRARRAAA